MALDIGGGGGKGWGPTMPKGLDPIQQNPIQGIKDMAAGAPQWGGKFSDAVKNGLAKLDPSKAFKAPQSDFVAKAPQSSFVAQAPTSTYQAKMPGISQVDFADAIKKQMGQPVADMSAADATAGNQYGLAQTLMGRGNTAYGQEQGLIGQLQNESMGQGPGSTLAQNMLNQATQNNVAQGAGMIASQKGINPALAARMISQNTANANQQAAQQGANLGLQQQLAARQQLGGMVGNDLNLNTGTASSIFNTGRGQDISSALGVGGLNQQKFGTEVGGQGAQNSAINTGSLGYQGMNAGTANHNADMVVATNTTNANTANQNAGLGENAVGINADTANKNNAAKSGMIGGLTNAAGAIGAGVLGGLASGGAGGAAGAGGEAVAGGDAAETIGALGAMAAYGAKVPGRANVPGDSPKNDTKSYKLSPGEIVIPRSHASPEGAKQFVAELMKKNGRQVSYKDVLQKQDELHKAVMALSKHGEKKNFYDGGTAGDEADDEDAADTTEAPDASTITPDSFTGASDAGIPTTAPSNVSNLFSAMPDMPKVPQEIAPEHSANFASPEDLAQSASIIKASSPERSNPNTIIPASTSAPMSAPTQPAGPDYFAKANEELTAGIKGNAAAAEHYAQAAQKAQTQLAQNMKDAQDKYQQAYAQVDAENKQLTADVVNAKIDPNRVWENTGTGGKIAAGIGILLSGIGSGLTGQPNLALKVIDETIARDIDAQKAELGKKETLLSRNYQKYGNIHMAYQATASQMYAVAQGQIASAAAKMGGQQAVGNAQVAMGQLDSQRGVMQQQLALEHLKGQVAGGEETASNLSPQTAEKLYPGQWTKLPNGTVGVGYTKDDAKAVRDIQKSAGNLQNTLDEMRDFMKGGAAAVGTERYSRAEALQARAVAQVNELAGQKRLTDKDVELVKEQIPHIDSLLQGNAGAKLDENQRNIDNVLDNYYSTHLMNYKKVPFTKVAGSIARS